MPPTPQPYIGPRPFERHESGLFAGRKREAAELAALVRAHSLTLLTGESGCGKTSLVNAALIPLLESTGSEVLPIIRPRAAAPGVRPTGLLPQALAAHRRETPVGRSQSIGVLMVDQAEDLFAGGASADDAQELISELQSALASAPLLRALVIVRSEEAPVLESLIGAPVPGSIARLTLERLRREDAVEAVLVPAALCGIAFAPGAIDRLIDDLLTVRLKTTDGRVQVLGEFVDPMHLQLVCRGICEALPASPATIRPEDIPEIEEAEATVRRFCGEVLRRVSEGTGLAEDDLRHWVQRELLAPAHTRARLLLTATSSAALLNRAAEMLHSMGLLRCEEAESGRSYELAHDRLIPAILDEPYGVPVGEVVTSGTPSQPTDAGTASHDAPRNTEASDVSPGTRASVLVEEATRGAPAGSAATVAPPAVGSPTISPSTDWAGSNGSAPTAQSGPPVASSERLHGSVSDLDAVAAQQWMSRFATQLMARFVLWAVVALVAFIGGSYAGRIWLEHLRSPGSSAGHGARAVDAAAGATNGLMPQGATPSATARSSVVRADALIRAGDLPGAAAALREALAAEQRKGTPAGEAAILAQLGAAHAARSDASDAVYCYGRAAGLARQIGDQAMAARLLRAIGDVHAGQGAVQAAVDAYQQALSIQRARHDTAAESQTLSTIGQIYGAQHQFRESLRFYNMALDASRRATDKRRQAEILLAMSDVSAASGAPITAADLRRQAQALKR